MSRIQSPDFKYAKDKVRFLVFLENWAGQYFSLVIMFTHSGRKEKWSHGNGLLYHMQHGMVLGQKDPHYK